MLPLVVWQKWGKLLLYVFPVKFELLQLCSKHRFDHSLHEFYSSIVVDLELISTTKSDTK